MLILLCACTNLPPRAVEYGIWDNQRVLLEALSSWQLSGRVNVRYEGESHTPRIRWQQLNSCLLYTSPSPRDRSLSRMPSSA